jgi:N-acetyl-anhydromuramyl-L-alanine amidase AmpD
MSRVIRQLVIHCAATPNGVVLARAGRTAAKVIDTWHGQPVRDATGRVIREHMFERSQRWRSLVRPQFAHLGYHYVIDCDGTREAGRDEQEIGAHVANHNADSLGICLGGTDAFTRAQWADLAQLVPALLAKYPSIELTCGHRDLSPDKNGNGVIERHEWLKICPGFDVAAWLRGGMVPLIGHIHGE